MRVIGNAFLDAAPCGKANTTFSYNAFVSGGCGTNSITNPLSSYLAGFIGDPGTYTLTPTSILRDKGNPTATPRRPRGQRTARSDALRTSARTSTARRRLVSAR